MFILNIKFMLCHPQYQYTSNCISFLFVIIIGIEQQQVRRNGRTFDSEFQARDRKQTDGPEDPLNIGNIQRFNL